MISMISLCRLLLIDLTTYATQSLQTFMYEAMSLSLYTMVTKFLDSNYLRFLLTESSATTPRWLLEKCFGLELLLLIDKICRVSECCTSEHWIYVEMHALSSSKTCRCRDAARHVRRPNLSVPERLPFLSALFSLCILWTLSYIFDSFDEKNNPFHS